MATEIFFVFLIMILPEHVYLDWKFQGTFKIKYLFHLKAYLYVLETYHIQVAKSAFNGYHKLIKYWFD